MVEWIKIGNPVLLGNRIENDITTSKGLGKYFRKAIFYATYDEKIQYNPSILNIPAVGAFIAFAWLAGAELRVGDLDEEFALSMRELCEEFRPMYPNLLHGKLVVKRAWKNEPEGEGLALFFSGGLDSTYSLYELIDKDPRLIMVKGFDFYMDRPEDEGMWQRWVGTYGEFAKKKGLRINYIRTNSRACLDEYIIDRRFRGELGLPFWEGLQHSVLLISLAAPLSIGRFNKLCISASRTADSPTKLNPYATAPNTDEKVTWAGMEVTHFGYIHRYLKANALVEHLRTGEITLRSCYKYLRYKWNCSECEKCGRVLAFIIAEGIDPNTCGFEVDDETFDKIRFTANKNWGWLRRIRLHWMPWIESLPEEIPNSYGLREFVRWIKEFAEEQNVE